MSAVVAREAPTTADAVAALLREGRRVRPVGGATKLDWGACGPAPELEVSTAGLTEIVEHNEGDLTTVVGAGVSLAAAQKRFAKAGQRLCLDPPDGGGRATVGGVVATGDSGPLRHRYGTVRDLILGVLVALPDGSVARAGSKVIKNVAGYDLAKLMCGALGTLGVVCEVTLRLHPTAHERLTVIGAGDDAGALARAARALAAQPLELEALDLNWDGGHGELLARCAGHAAAETAQACQRAMRDGGLQARTVGDDEELWRRQRERQRAAAEGQAIARVSALPSTLEVVLGAAPAAVVRAALGLAWVRIDADPAALAALRERVAPAPCVLLDAPEQMRAAVDPWGVPDGPAVELMRRVKARFDPRGVCNPGRQVGGI